MDKIEKWTEKNNLRLNSNKTAEMVFSRKGMSASLPPSTINIMQQPSIELLGVTLQSNLSFD